MTRPACGFASPYLSICSSTLRMNVDAKIVRLDGSPLADRPSTEETLVEARVLLHLALTQSAPLSMFITRSAMLPSICGPGQRVRVSIPRFLKKSKHWYCQPRASYTTSMEAPGYERIADRKYARRRVNILWFDGTRAWSIIDLDGMSVVTAELLNCSVPNSAPASRFPMSWIIETSLRLRLMVQLLAVRSSSLGVRSADTIPLDVFLVCAAAVEIQTEAPGYPRKMLERLITILSRMVLMAYRS